jgi:hypothetical protein
MDQEKRFWSHVDIRSDDECWNWTAGTDSYGYGRFRFNDKRNKLAHRVAWILTYGDIPEGMLVCHHCDNPKCCNPDHLFLGTDFDNTVDKCNKDRQAKGQNVGNAKLNELDIIEIRSAHSQGQTHQYIANLFGVSKTVITNIVNNNAWKHVT